MSDPLNEKPATAVRTSDISGKRRRVRRGTRSCWECKRRKIKCIFASAEDVTCLNCQRRRVPCISQEVPEDLSLARKSNWHLGERIARIEDLIKDIINSKDDGFSNHSEGKTLLEDRPSSSETLTARLNNASPSRFQTPPTAIEVSTLTMHNHMDIYGYSYRILRIRLQAQLSLHLKVHGDNPSPKLQYFITCSQLFRQEAMLIYCSKRAAKHLYIPISLTFSHIASGHRKYLLYCTLRTICPVRTVIRSLWPGVCSCSQLLYRARQVRSCMVFLNRTASSCIA